VYQLQRGRDEYRVFFQHLDGGQSAAISEHCRLLFSRNSAEAVKNYLQNFIYPGDVLLVAETSNQWSLNRGIEATEWLRELQHFDDIQRMQSGDVQH
jgi:hypothetical protein